MALLLDLQKAYQSIRTRVKEMHLRRILWREKVGDPWQILAYVTVTFGDMAAALLLELAKRKATELGEEIDPVACRQLRDFTYVDDAALGGSQQEVNRMKATIPEILKTCGLKERYMAVSGDQDPDTAAQLGGKVLGIAYDLSQDLIMLQITLQFQCRGRHHLKKIINLGPRELEAIQTGSTPLTRQEVLSFLAGTFDSLGLLSLVLLHGKLLLRRL